MIKIFKAIILSLLVSCTTGATEISSDESEFPFTLINEKILFIGNSFTFYWNLPSQVEKMSIERGLNWEVSHLTVPSARLRDHWNNPNLKSILESETFDHVIIQEHSTNILTGEDGNPEFYFGQITSLIPDSTSIHFFSTWMYPSMEYLNINNEEYPIEESIKQIIDGTTTQIIPVGRAFKLFQEKYPQVDILMEDNKHPNPNGSYLASCIIFSHLSSETSLNLSKRYKGKDSKGIDIYYSIVEDEVLTFLQQISDEIIF